MALHTMQDLKMRQALPLEVKILMTKQRIRDWVNEFGVDGVYVSFSGGKDSTVLLHLVREDYPEIPAVFVDTGLEYPEIREFVKTFDNVVWLKPKLTFKQIINKYGYPFISKEVSNTVYWARRSIENNRETSRLKKIKESSSSKYNHKKYEFMLDAPFEIYDKCCYFMKENPCKQFEKQTGKKPILGQLAEESMKRTQGWMRTGCNAFEAKRPQSNPMAFWTEQDVLRYIKQNDIPIAKVYGNVVIDYDSDEVLDGQVDFSDFGLYIDNRKLKTTGCQRTGCMFCGYGCHLNNDQRFVQMKETHPKIYDYIMRPADKGGLNYKEIIDWLNEHGNLDIKY